MHRLAYPNRKEFAVGWSAWSCNLLESLEANNEQVYQDYDDVRRMTATTTTTVILTNGVQLNKLSITREWLVPGEVC